MGCQVNCQSGAWGVLTQYSLAVIAITLVLELMLINSGGKVSHCPKKYNIKHTQHCHCLLLNLEIGMISRCIRCVTLEWKQSQEITNNKMINNPVFVVC